VENELAAGVNILPEIRSIYRWDNEIQQDSEKYLSWVVAEITRDSGK
jgi:uncharacterized protein involved in tolerance to divalent cations